MNARVIATGEIKSFYPTRQSGYDGYVDEQGQWYYPKELDFRNGGEPFPGTEGSKSIRDKIDGREKLAEIARPYADMFSEENREGAIETFVQFLEYLTDTYNFCIVDVREVRKEFECIRKGVGGREYNRGRLHELKHFFGGELPEISANNEPQ